MRRLLIRPGAIGDFIVSLPALESLRGDYTEVWCAGQNMPIVRFADRVQSIVSAGLDRVGLLPAEDVYARLSTFHSIISWYGTNLPEFQQSVRDLPFRFLPVLPKGPGHAVDFYLDQARALGLTPISRYPVIPCPAVPRIFAAIHPFASSAAKRAPLATFERIAAQLDMPVRWVCGPEEELDGATRINDLYELACWLRGARVFVGNDSGIGHLAAAVGTPTLTLFRASDPKIWSPRGFACNYIAETPVLTSSS